MHWVQFCSVSLRQVSCGLLRSVAGSYKDNCNFHKCCYLASGFLQHAASYSRSQVSAKPAVDYRHTAVTTGTNDDAIMKTAREQLSAGSIGRLFAVVHVGGKQFKVTSEDIIIVEGDFGPDVGERIRLEKVLMLGGSEFSLIGRPLLRREEALVEATVIEKTLQYPKAWFLFKRRKRVRRFRLLQKPIVMLRINSVNALDITV